MTHGDMQGNIDPECIAVYRNNHHKKMYEKHERLEIAMCDCGFNTNSILEKLSISYIDKVTII